MFTAVNFNLNILLFTLHLPNIIIAASIFYIIIFILKKYLFSVTGVTWMSHPHVATHNSSVIDMKLSASSVIDMKLNFQKIFAAIKQTINVA